MRFDRPFTLPGQAEDTEAEDGSPMDAEPGRARLRSSVVVIAAAIAAALGTWIWMDSDSRADLTASGRPQDRPSIIEPSTAAGEPARTSEMMSQDDEPPAAADDVPPGWPASPTAETPTEDGPAELQRQAQVIEALEQGQLYAAIGRHDVAASHYAEAVRLDPGNAPARYRLALAYVRNGQDAPARREMAALEELDPSLASLLGNLLR